MWKVQIFIKNISGIPISRITLEVGDKTIEKYKFPKNMKTTATIITQAEIYTEDIFDEEIYSWTLVLKNYGKSYTLIPLKIHTTSIYEITNTQLMDVFMVKDKVGKSITKSQNVDYELE